jgi:hypothetical protein
MIDNQDGRHPLPILFRSLLPHYRDAKSVLRVDRSIHALGVVVGRQLYAPWPRR